MGRRDDLIAQYADDLKNKCGMDADMELLRKVTTRGRRKSRHGQVNCREEEKAASLSRNLGWENSSPPVCMQSHKVISFLLPSSKT